MQLDAQAMLSDNQDLAQVAGTYLSTKSYDLGVAGVDALGNTVIKDFGRGNVPPLLVQVTEQFVGANGTVDFQLITATNEALTSGVKVIQTTGAIPIADLKPGYQPRLAIPVGIDQRFLGLQYVIAVTTQTAGKVTAGLVAVKQTNPGV